MSGDLEITVTSDVNLRNVSAKLEELAQRDGGKLRKEFRKALRKAADDLVREQQSAIRSTTIKGEKRRRGGRSTREYQSRLAGGSRGLRESIAASLKKSIRYSGKTVGVEVKSSETSLPPGMRRLPVLTNRGTWRHPVYGGPGWASQRAQPAHWFTRTAKNADSKAERDLGNIVRQFGSEVEKAMQGN